jgi:multidrug resistance efflux pump
MNSLIIKQGVTKVRNLIFLFLAAIVLNSCSGKDIKNSTYSGTIELTEHVLGAKVAGRISSLLVQEGDLVKQGQVLATLDRFEQAQKDHDRAQELFKTGGADAQSVEYAQLALEDQRVVAPLDGIVLIKAAEVGEIISSGGGIIVVGDLKDQWVRIYVPEGVINRIKMGQQARISVDGTKQSYKGHVSFIATKAEFTPRNVQTPQERVTQDFAVKVAFDEPDANLHPGTAADIQFLFNQ